jgi:hypothetical protein
MFIQNAGARPAHGGATETNRLFVANLQADPAGFLAYDSAPESIGPPKAHRLRVVDFAKLHLISRLED